MKALRSMRALAYPLDVYLGLSRFSPRELAIGLAALFVLRAVLRWPRPDAAQPRPLLVPGLLLGSLLAATALLDEARFLLIVPALVNLGLLAASGRTLLGPGPMLVETFARRLQAPDLPPEEVVYCRRVTAVWRGLFALNAAVCLGLARHGDLALWTLYNGLLA